MLRKVARDAFPTALCLCLFLLHVPRASPTGVKSPLDLSYILNDLSVELGGLGSGTREPATPVASSGKPGDYVYPHGVHSPARAGDGPVAGNSPGTVFYSNNAGDALLQNQPYGGAGLSLSSASAPGVQAAVYGNNAGDRVFNQNVNRPSSVNSSPGLQTLLYANNADGTIAHQHKLPAAGGINAPAPTVRYAPAVVSGLSGTVSESQPKEYVYPLYPNGGAKSVSKRDSDLSSFGQKIGSNDHYPIEVPSPSDAGQSRGTDHYPIDIPPKAPKVQYANAGGLDKYPLQRRMILPSPYISNNVPYAVNNIIKNNDIYDNDDKGYGLSPASSSFPSALFPSFGDQKDSPTITDPFSDSLFSTSAGLSQPQNDPFSDSLFSNIRAPKSPKDHSAVLARSPPVGILGGAVGQSPLNLGQTLFPDAKPNAGALNPGSGLGLGPQSPVVLPQPGKGVDFGHPPAAPRPSGGQSVGDHYGLVVPPQSATSTGFGQPAAVAQAVPAVTGGLQPVVGGGAAGHYGTPTQKHTFHPVHDVYGYRKELQCWPQFFLEYTHDFSGSVWQDVKGHVRVQKGRAVFEGHGFLAIPFFACNDLLPRYSMIFVINPAYSGNAPQAIIGNSVFSNKASLLVSLTRNVLTLVLRQRAPDLTAQQLLDHCHSRKRRSVGTASQYGGVVGTAGSGFQPQLPTTGLYPSAGHSTVDAGVVVLQLPIAGEVTVTIAQEKDWVSLSAGDQQVSKPGRLPTLTNEALYVGAGADPRGGDGLAHYTGTFDSFLFEKCP